MWVTVAVSAFFMVLALATFEVPVLQFIWAWCLGTVGGMWIIRCLESGHDWAVEEARKKREFWARLNSDGTPK